MKLTLDNLIKCLNKSFFIYTSSDPINQDTQIRSFADNHHDLFDLFNMLPLKFNFTYEGMNLDKHFYNKKRGQWDWKTWRWIKAIGPDPLSVSELFDYMQKNQIVKKDLTLDNVIGYLKEVYLPGIQKGDSERYNNLKIHQHNNLNPQTLVKDIADRGECVDYLLKMLRRGFNVSFEKFEFCTYFYREYEIKFGKKKLPLTIEELFQYMQKNEIDDEE